MSKKHSEANRLKWAKVPKAERSKRMSTLAQDRMNALSPFQKKKVGRALTRARLAKSEV